MAKNYPSFGAYVRLDLNGKVIIDYNDPNALRQLTITLLKKDFDLDVDIPVNRLIPTVPQRLNYVLWVEDLVAKLTQFLGTDDKNITGLDVGTGSCAIFPLIGSTIHKNWRFVATDVDPFNIECAQKNVNNNNLNDRVRIIECKDETIFHTIVDMMTPETIHFSMTNPPFFSDNFNDSNSSCDESQMKSDSHIISSRDESRSKLSYSSRKKSAANTSIATEAIVSGGEVAFVTKMIDESLLIRERIMIYSAMLGKKRSLLELKNIIEQHVKKGLIASFVSTEFCQGITKRWGIAWTFISGLNLKDVPTIKSVKSKPPLVYYLPPKMKETEYNMQSVSERIKFLLVNDLQIDTFEVRQSKKSIEFLIKANKNSWSNQRKRRREAKLKLKCDSANDAEMKSSDTKETHDKSFDSTDQTLDNSCDMEVTNHLNSFGTESSNLKRKMEEDIDNSQISTDCELKKTKTRVEYCANQLYLLDCSLLIKRDKQSILIQMQTQQLSQSHESTYQLFQYFKNNLI